MVCLQELLRKIEDAEAKEAPYPVIINHKYKGGLNEQI